MENIKPCPFCGNDVHIGYSLGHWYDPVYIDSEDELDLEVCSFIRCSFCDIEFCSSSYDTPREFIKQWNTRVDIDGH